jgi:hypothetical protein
MVAMYQTRRRSPAEILRQVIPTAFASFYLGELVLQ